MKKRILFAIPLLAVGLLTHPLQTTAEVLPDSEVDALCQVAGYVCEVDPDMIRAVMYHESRFDTEAANGPHVGLMQINPAFFRERAAGLGIAKDQMAVPYLNVLLASGWLGDLYEVYGDWGKVLSAYHTGKIRGGEAYASMVISTYQKYKEEKDAAIGEMEEQQKSPYR